MHPPITVQVYVDGGFRRGTDVLKALALGARAVGVGRPALYGLATYGQQGVERMLELMREEIVVAMRLLGCPTLAHVRRDMVTAPALAQHVGVAPADSLSDAVYVTLPVAKL